MEDTRAFFDIRDLFLGTYHQSTNRYEALVQAKDFLVKYPTSIYAEEAAWLLKIATPIVFNDMVNDYARQTLADAFQSENTPRSLYYYTLTCHTFHDDYDIMLASAHAGYLPSAVYILYCRGALSVEPDILELVKKAAQENDRNAMLELSMPNRRLVSHAESYILCRRAAKLGHLYARSAVQEYLNYADVRRYKWFFRVLSAKNGSRFMPNVYRFLGDLQGLFDKVTLHYSLIYYIGRYVAPYMDSKWETFATFKTSGTHYNNLRKAHRIYVESTDVARNATHAWIWCAKQPQLRMHKDVAKIIGALVWEGRKY
jgi:hypothetical protein